MLQELAQELQSRHILQVRHSPQAPQRQAHWQKMTSKAQLVQALGLAGVASPTRWRRLEA